MRLSALILIVTIASVLFSCNGAGQEKSSEKPSKVFAPPAVPQEITDPEQRTTHLARHFWDNLNPNDSTFINSRSKMSEAFSKYVDIVAQLPIDEASKLIKEFMSSIEKEKRVYVAMLRLAMEILYDPNSPRLNEALYVPFAESALQSSALTENGFVQHSHRLEVARKNNPGSTANDFSFTTSKGEVKTLHTTADSPVIIFFHDPECENCQKSANILHNDTTIARLTKKGIVQPLMVYTEGNKEVWQANKEHHPAGWISGCDKEESIRNNRIYELRAMPSIYFIDKEKKVVLKDVSAAKLIDHLKRHYKN